MTVFKIKYLKYISKSTKCQLKTTTYCRMQLLVTRRSSSSTTQILQYDVLLFPSSYHNLPHRKHELLITVISVMNCCSSVNILWSPNLCVFPCLQLQKHLPTQRLWTTRTTVTLFIQIILMQIFRRKEFIYIWNCVFTQGVRKTRDYFCSTLYRAQLRTGDQWIVGEVKSLEYMISVTLDQLCSFVLSQKCSGFCWCSHLPDVAPHMPKRLLNTKEHLLPGKSANFSFSIFFSKPIELQECGKHVTYILSFVFLRLAGCVVVQIVYMTRFVVAFLSNHR